MAESYSVEAILTARDAGFEAGMKAAQKSTLSLGKVLKSGIGFGAMAATGNKAVSVVTSFRNCRRIKRIKCCMENFRR